MTVNIEVFLEEVRRGLEELRRLDPGCQVFGASAHRYELNPPVSEGELTAIESKYGFSCPRDYRAFMLHLGNGGAGPFYGVFRFGEVDDGFGFASWEARELQPGEPFPHRDAWDGEGLDFGEPDPDDFENENDFDAAFDEWQDSPKGQEAEDAYLRGLGTDRGALPICHHGCALRDWLIVSGPETGRVWHDAGADHNGIAPCAWPNGNRMTFAEWYLNWLRRTLEEVAARSRGEKRHPVTDINRRPFSARVLSQFTVTDRGPFLEVSILEGTIKTGGYVRVRLEEETTVIVQVNRVEYVDHIGEGKTVGGGLGASELEGRTVVKGSRVGGMYPCPCCAYLTIADPGGFEICPVCFWEDGGQGAADAEVVRGGPNGNLFLSQARKNFGQMGASSLLIRLTHSLPFGSAPVVDGAFWRCSGSASGRRAVEKGLIGPPDWPSRFELAREPG